MIQVIREGAMAGLYTFGLVVGFVVPVAITIFVGCIISGLIQGFSKRRNEK